MSIFSQATALVVFRITLSVVVLIESLITVYRSLDSTTQSHLGTLLPWVAAVEALGAVMLLLPQTIKAGGFMLLLIFVFAIVVHGPAGQMPLFVYAAGVILVMTNDGAYSRKNLRTGEAPAKEG